MATSTSCDSRTCIISYNMHGCNQGKPFLAELCQSNSAKLIVVEEHWLTPANMVSIFNFTNNYTVFGISAMERAVSQSVLKGRPHGGVASLVHNSIAN